MKNYILKKIFAMKKGEKEIITIKEIKRSGLKYTDTNFRSCISYNCKKLKLPVCPSVQSIKGKTGKIEGYEIINF